MKQNPKATAYDLYFKTNLTQAQIAERAGVSTRTLYDWMKQGNWKTLKANSRIMPAQIVDDIYNHISHLNWKIKTRDFEDRYPSREEAETLRKLISTIPKIKLNVSKGESAQSMINFVSWLQTRNNDAAIFISDYIDEYLHAGRERGMEPYEFEYDADQYYNPTDYPWRKEHTFEQRVSDETKTPPLASLRGASQAPEQSATACPDELSGWQPRQNTEQETQPEAPDTPPASLPARPFDGREASQAPEQSATKQPRQNTEQETQPNEAEPTQNTSLRGAYQATGQSATWQPRQNTEQEENQQKQEPNQRSRQGRDQNQTGSKPEATQQSQNPPKPANNQPPDLKKLPDPTSENKKSKIPTKAGRKVGKEEEEIDRNDPDYVQKVFESWKKMAKRDRRR
ncbi:MAG: hypothetical protein JSS82_13555 [Bacteroidetes bacterium]|nr:hypothetical protein [Bacteroidota bacterium]